MSKTENRQINFEAPPEVIEAIEEIRRLSSSPIPSRREAICQAILNERDALRRVIAQERKAG
jgi:hypothetical protein